MSHCPTLNLLSSLCVILRNEGHVHTVQGQSDKAIKSLPTLTGWEDIKVRSGEVEDTCQTDVEIKGRVT